MNVLQFSLLGGAAFASAADLLAGLTFAEATRPVPGVPYTLAEVLSHLSITQRASLDLASGRAQAWPENLAVWPDTPPTEAEFGALLAELHAGLAEAQVLAGDPSSRARDVLTDLAVHSAYHWGQVALLRRLQGTWPAVDQT
ncbi:damage-inducible protein DinB [Deinococcus sp. HMF7620]|uniref:Damage-inducible protein DinB n=1 Tax=Deinococcus arboris TaxID=2682977 RepID=A0A7C9LT15_9DEIO|nr:MULTISPECIES: maleylpyruvate isomerase N-terminal domain-containing protein [Deinococcus]MBZ9749250.1 DinB family protein [Deinococcus betulae]MVN88661.1 damage-inducible protein DinB [Deinococcus arboris]